MTNRPGRLTDHVRFIVSCEESPDILIIVDAHFLEGGMDFDSVLVPQYIRESLTSAITKAIKQGDVETLRMWEDSNKNLNIGDLHDCGIPVAVMEILEEDFGLVIQTGSKDIFVAPNWDHDTILVNKEELEPD